MLAAQAPGYCLPPVIPNLLLLLQSTYRCEIFNGKYDQQQSWSVSLGKCQPPVAGRQGQAECRGLPAKLARTQELDEPAFEGSRGIAWGGHSSPLIIIDKSDARLIITYCCFLATLVALHLTPVSKSVSR